jgi:hypothetical protein
MTDPSPPAPRPVLPVLSYEKPLVYRYRSDLPPPGPGAKVFWKGCFLAGKLLGLVYRPRAAPRLYSREP